MSQQIPQPQRVSLSRRPIKATEPFGSTAVGGNSGKPSSLWSQGSPLPVTTPTGSKKGSPVDRRGSPVSGTLHSPKGSSLLEFNEVSVSCSVYALVCTVGITIDTHAHTRAHTHHIQYTHRRSCLPKWNANSLYCADAKVLPKVPGRGTPSPVTMVAGGVNPRRANSLNSLNDQDCYMNSVWPKATEKASQVSLHVAHMQCVSTRLYCGWLCLQLLTLCCLFTTSCHGCHAHTMYYVVRIDDVIIVKCFNREHFVVARLQSLMQ